MLTDSRRGANANRTSPLSVTVVVGRLITVAPKAGFSYGRLAGAAAAAGVPGEPSSPGEEGGASARPGFNPAIQSRMSPISGSPKCPPTGMGFPLISGAAVIFLKR
jgi:hypothetical protein